MYSIYHFFRHLILQKFYFNQIAKLEEFPFDEQLLSCKNIGQFPDLAIRLNGIDPTFKGGELVELKDSKTYSIASFNSTIPSGKKEISQIIKNENSNIKKQMEAAGDDILSLPIRDVYYLLRGFYKNNLKIVLIHGSFFETISIDNLISQSFQLVLEERLKAENLVIEEKIKNILLNVFSQQESFSKVRNVEKASVKLRFRVMTEVKTESNILNTKKYPDIIENTINLVIPCHAIEEEKIIINKFNKVFLEKETLSFKVFKIKHILNGYFIVFQQML